jgi:hypothetical protein
MDNKDSSLQRHRLALSPTSVAATYTPQRLPQFKGNPLIEALPPVMTDDELYQALSLQPDFEAEQRQWSSEERILMLKTLSKFMVPLARHVELSRSLDAMLRGGYVGRAPLTPEHAHRYQLIYENQKKGVSCSQPDSTPSQLSTLLMGLSGMGKTSAVKRWFSRMPQVIYHEQLNLYQVTYLHVEMPSDGSSVKGLAHGILQQLDQLIPGANYYENYAIRGKPGADTLMRAVARVLNMHCVGFLIADEIQNLANAHKGKQTVMTELVSACNFLGLPILFIGTNKAARVFSLDFRQSRRASGHGIEDWGRLPGMVEQGEVDEWFDFLSVLWSYQWVRNPVPLDAQFVSTMHHYSQGVIDIAIKLFASAQARAILDGTEQLTTELIADVYNREMKLLHPMVEALRNDDLERLALFEDIAPVGLDALLEVIGRKLKGKASPAYKVKPPDSTFAPRIAAAMVSAGFDGVEAEQAADEVVAQGKAKNLLQGTQAALGLLTANKPVPRAKAAPGSNAEPPPPAANYVERPDDYRQAIELARSEGTTIYAQLKQLGMARPLEELLELA